MSRFTCALAVIAATLGAAATVSAAPPLTIEVDETVPETVFSCAGLDEGELLFSINGTLHIITTPKKEITAVASKFTVTWSANGKSLSSVGSAPVMTTFNPDGSIAQTKVAGLLAAITVPGSGVVLLDTGLIIFEGPFFEGPVSVLRGPHESLAGDVEELCAYFTAS